MGIDDFSGQGVKIHLGRPQKGAGDIVLHLSDADIAVPHKEIRTSKGI